MKNIRDEAAKSAFEVSELDLYRSGFSPALLEQDEPEWDNPDKAYSDEVMELAQSLKDKDVLVFVFPVWWFSIPAMLKGYFDRVWNHGLIYGAGKKLPVKTVRWIALVGGSREDFERRQNDKLMEQFLNGRIASYCGATDSKVEFLYNTIGAEEEIKDRKEHFELLFQQAGKVIRDLK